MSQYSLQNGFTAGELSPSLFGRTDYAKYRQAASTMRNGFVNYRGGYNSRAGLRYILASKQTATASDILPPRLIPFQFNLNQGYVLEFGNVYMRVIYQGGYVVENPTTISGATKATQIVITDTAHGYSNGDWVFITGMLGMTQLNGRTWVISDAATNTYKLKSLFGNYVNSTSFGTYTSGGAAERIYTVVSPYAVADLPYLKYTQSADTMSLTCVNQETGTDYAPYDLVRNSNTNWVFTATSFGSNIDPPTGLTVTAHNSTTPSTYYSYAVTAVNSLGEESVATATTSSTVVENNDISVNAGSNSMVWVAASGATSYDVYATTPSYSAAPPSGVPFGYIGSTYGTGFVDTNIIPDFTKTPPLANNPFPSTGNYPGVVGYFQQRRVYANTKNAPDTYFMSRPGAYTNMDSSVPTTDKDAIIGTPWAQQINGIQFLTPMSYGLIAHTGSGAWLVNGGSSSAITPADQTATAQSYIGCNNHIQPLTINNVLLFVQAKESIVRDLYYNFYDSLYRGDDKTILASHLFNYRQIQQWCYAEEPYKIIWAVRNDGELLSLTYLKDQEVFGWAHHDTKGIFANVCSVTEPPVDAVYAVVKRYITGESRWMYYIERMDNRNWQTAEDCFCVDAGLQYPVTYPNATLIPASATGTNNISGIDLITGGSNYTSPIVTAIDPAGTGSGATFSTTLSGGVITAVNILTQGSDYSQGTYLNFSDATGSGAVANAIVTNIVAFTASSGVFTSDMVGNVIRIGNNNATSAAKAYNVLPNGGGQATITSYVSSTQVNANITTIITNVIPDDLDQRPVPVSPNQWSISTPISTIDGLNHIEGMEVAILGDGNIFPNQVVTNGQVTLPQPVSYATIGLPYICQLQTMYLDPPSPETTQGKRKNIAAVTVRVESSRGFSVGCNQIDQSTLPDNAIPTWINMEEVKQRDALVSAGSSIPLFTGDIRPLVTSDWDTRGQVAIQQSYALPLNVLAVVIEYNMGDTSG